MSLSAGCGAQGGQRFMDDPRSLQGSGSVGSETLRAEGQGPVALPTDIRVQPYAGVTYALNADQARRVVGWVNPAEVEQVSSTGSGWDARYLVPVANAPVQGPADALVTIVFFMDFSSPHCAAMFEALKNVRLRFGRDLRVVYKLRPGDTDERAYRASIAAVEAYRQKGPDGFVAMAEQLFNRTDDLTFAHLVDAAARVELEPRTFTLALRYQTHSGFVAADIMQADSAQVRDVPTLFVNGRRNIGVSTERLIESMIDREVVYSRARLSAGIPRQRLYESILDPPPTERSR
ncbi:MAG: thioredoxin domain-containing protein [Myxococcales bacterium]|nr:thioredoxin domain-containing protein [Myxococcales bacterium]